MESLGTFDVIFFRNVLIYFDALSRHQAIATLYKILADDGILFVGHAEANLFTNSPFTPAPFTQAFAFCKKSKQDLLKETKSPKSPVRAPVFKTKRVFPFSKKSQTSVPELSKARELADRGEFNKATEICEEHLNQFGPTADSFFLLGVIRDASNDAKQAEKLFRKALYLDPNHLDSLIFLSLIAEKSGDHMEAKHLKQRIDRLKSDAVQN
jgi:chemotaxis protein methyltransferase WspC